MHNFNHTFNISTHDITYGKGIRGASEKYKLYNTNSKYQTSLPIVGNSTAHNADIEQMHIKNMAKNITVTYKFPEVDISRQSACKVFAWVWLIYRILLTLFSIFSSYYFLKQIRKDKLNQKNMDFLYYQPKTYLNPITSYLSALTLVQLSGIYFNIEYFRLVLTKNCSRKVNKYGNTHFKYEIKNNPKSARNRRLFNVCMYFVYFEYFFTFIVPGILFIVIEILNRKNGVGLTKIFWLACLGLFMGCLFSYLIHTIMRFLIFIYGTVELINDMEMIHGGGITSGGESVPGSLLETPENSGRNVRDSWLENIPEQTCFQNVQNPNQNLPEFQPSQVYSHNHYEINHDLLQQKLENLQHNNIKNTHNCNLPSPPSQMPPRTYV